MPWQAGDPITSVRQNVQGIPASVRRYTTIPQAPGGTSTPAPPLRSTGVQIPR